MVSPAPPLSFDTTFDPQTGIPVEVAPGTVRVTAPNAGPFTFTGTNTFLVGDTELAVIDPGPDDSRHLAALVRAIGGRTVKAIVLTHTHRDHTALARRLAVATGAPLWFEGQHRLSRSMKPFEINPMKRSCDWALVPGRRIADGEELRFGDITLKAMATPGHCANHLAFGIVGTPHILTGDHVMGWNTTVIAAPDGSMADYLDSLDRLIAASWTHYLPAHGGPITKGREYARGLRAHREMRNGQILQALQSGSQTVRNLRRRIYPGLAPATQVAAAMTLRAHLEYLETRGNVISKSGLFATHYRLA